MEGLLQRFLRLSGSEEETPAASGPLPLYFTFNGILYKIGRNQDGTAGPYRKKVPDYKAQTVIAALIEAKVLESCERGRYCMPETTSQDTCEWVNLLERLPKRKDPT